ncbi:hypothetical protein F909_02499 [Acinetobacter sp. ANC 3929]|uniref:hypothetical protein n=1 Tax=unclassified Acinetobacter TaxID=196816 RepID=UPI0002D03F22|nr:MULTISPECIES: hypothetical protein [unclassified Acinetobacter]ENW81208.1 hypothetical protein F909_02499 [Acinetobacter sp. ANC 3929]MCH7352292.1 hypothetical protein [Acinetobacter sp. NIPH 2023]MCH7356590.1 hypothetical protein [Acinetobacter sp. NIPH 1958]MCH7358259.1 hypothetical protein [Acinetobacter sp. NIPH 2024]
MAAYLGQSNLVSFAQKLVPRNIKLVRHGGHLSQSLDELGTSNILRLDLIQDAQVVLHLLKAL